MSQVDQSCLVLKGIDTEVDVVNTNAPDFFY